MAVIKDWDYITKLVTSDHVAHSVIIEAVVRKLGFMYGAGPISDCIKDAT